MEEGTFYGLTMKTPVIYAEIQVLLMYEKELTQLSERTTICSELTSHLTKCPEIHSDGIRSHDLFKPE